MDDLKSIIESLLFVAEEALSAEQIKKLVGPVEASEVHQALAALRAEHDARRGGFFLAEVAGGFQFRTRPEYNAWVRRLVAPKPVRLSKAALETLAIIAYKQPVIRTDVEHIRGVDCGGVLRQLLERKLIRVLGRREIPGRPLIYATTKKFLETFELKDLRDLPTPREVEEFGKAPLEERGHVTIEPEEEDAAAGADAARPAPRTPAGEDPVTADGYDGGAGTAAEAPGDPPPAAAGTASESGAPAAPAPPEEGAKEPPPSEKKLDFDPERA